MCTFSGLFGISTILFSLNESSTIPHQNPFYELELDFNKYKSIFAGGITGAILGFLPGFGPAQGTVIAQAASGASDNDDDDTVNFLLATSGLNVSDCLFSLIAIYIIGNPRSGIAVYMSYLISEMNLNHLVIFIFASLIAVSVSLVLALKLGDSFSRLMSRVDYKKLSIGVIILQIVILYIFVFYYQAPIGYMTLALITSTAMGMLPHFLGVGKSHLMGVLIIPAIVIYMQMFIWGEKMEKTLLEEFERNPKILLNENLMIKQLNKINDNSIEATNELISDFNIPKLNQNTLKFIFYELIGNIYDHYKFSEAHIAGRQNKNKYDFIFMDNGISIINSFKNANYPVEMIVIL